jgi:CRISPR-associated protein Csh1
MIKELINFTENLIEDIPEIMQWKVQPSKGLHVFIDINEQGKWINQSLELGKDYDYYDGKNQDIKLWNDCIQYQGVSDYITMNKVQKFDSKQKIHSCSPFAVAFNFNFNDVDKAEYGIRKWKKGEKVSEENKLANEQLIRRKRIEIVESRLSDYRKNASEMYFGNNDEHTVRLEGFYSSMKSILEKISTFLEFQNLSEKDYVRINLKSVPLSEQDNLYSKYLQSEIFNDDKLSHKGLGVIGFKTGFPDKKPFLKHRTGIGVKGVNYRFSREEALMLNNFEKLAKRKCLPNPLPFVIDKRELNSEIIKIFNSEANRIEYREVLEKLFDKNNLKNLPNYYLINYRNTINSGLVFNDVDFVPLFRYRFENKITISNLTDAGFKEDKLSLESIDTVFDFERIVVKAIFNNSLIKIKDGKYTSNYFGEIEPKYVIGGDVMHQLILKYRRAFYNYIYKSKMNAIDMFMFDDMMYNSIFSNIKQDDIKGRFEWNNEIKKKLNIWFSLNNLFNNNLKDINMASKIPDLISKMRSVAKRESNIETPEEFAFGAGQIVSYLIDRSAATNKTYSMLEPYLQKNKASQLQDSIAQSIAIYKHDISVYKGKFEILSSEILADDCNAEMKPLLKFFLAGCFCPCVIYDKAEK